MNKILILKENDVLLCLLNLLLLFYFFNKGIMKTSVCVLVLFVSVIEFLGVKSAQYCNCITPHGDNRHINVDTSQLDCYASDKPVTHLRGFEHVQGDTCPSDYLTCFCDNHQKVQCCFDFPTTTTTTTAGPHGGCFPSTGRVTLINGNTVNMEELKTGDRIQSGIPRH